MTITKRFMVICGRTIVKDTLFKEALKIKYTMLCSEYVLIVLQINSTSHFQVKNYEEEACIFLRCRNRERHYNSNVFPIINKVTEVSRSINSCKFLPALLSCRTGFEYVVNVGWCKNVCRLCQQYQRNQTSDRSDTSPLPEVITF